MRNARKLGDFDPARVRVADGDVLDAGKLKEAMVGHDVVYANLALHRGAGRLDVRLEASKSTGTGRSRNAWDCRNRSDGAGRDRCARIARHARAGDALLARRCDLMANLTISVRSLPTRWVLSVERGDERFHLSGAPMAADATLAGASADVPGGCCVRSPSHAEVCRHPWVAEIMTQVPLESGLRSC